MAALESRMDRVVFLLERIAQAQGHRGRMGASAEIA